MKYVPVYAWLLMFVFHTSGQAQNQTDLPTTTIQSETKDVSTSYWPKMGMTRTMIQDRKGNIWISSGTGIFRYDGKSFTPITSQVSSVRFHSVLEDRKGNFWFSSVGSGVYYYDGESFRHFTTTEGLAHNVVTCMYEDKTGHIWFGTGGGASRYDGKSFRNYRMDEGMSDGALSILNFRTRDNAINSIMEDQTGKFWFGTGGSTYVYDGKSYTVFTNQDGKAFTNVGSIIEDRNGHIWLSGTDGLWRFDGRSFTNMTQHSVGCVYEGKQGDIWTSSETAQGWVLSRYDAKSLSDKKPAVTEINPQLGIGVPIVAILEANDGNIWFGSGYRYDGKTITKFEESQKDKTVKK